MGIVEHISTVNEAPLLVAELSGNHGGVLDKAIELLETAVKSGADAIKIQTYKPETITVHGRCDRFLIKDGLWSGYYLHELYEMAMTPWEWHLPLAERAKELDVDLFSSPFDESAVDFLEDTIKPEVYKVASFELNHFPLLQKIGETKKPVLASVGVSNFEEIEIALETLYSSGCPSVTLLHCVSEYPAEVKDFNLNKIKVLREKFSTTVGLSDHSLGFSVALAATALGARVVEKHFTLDRNKSSVDGQFSMLPEEFKKMTDEVRLIHSALGGNKSMDSVKKFKGARYKRSILVSAHISKGDLLTAENIRVARPGDGLCPSLWYEVLGAKAEIDMDIGHPLKSEDFSYCD
jgi:N-acetylneuraminate synthase